ncbi:MAG: hypothetical protein KDK11_14765 [Maritimibacter sp.]|nr:hypothetical protein [Maritimibacter sp.]
MTRDHDQVQALFAALNLGYQASVLNVSRADVALVQANAEQVLDHDDPAFLAVNRFATDYELAVMDPATDLPRIGEALRKAIQLALQPDPPGLDRRDIHG